MSKPSAPQPPNPATVAAAQQGANVGTAVAQSTLNNVNQVTPYGNTTFNQTGGYTDPSSGQFVPSYTETTSLTPQEQAILSGTQNVGLQMMPAASNLANQAVQTTANPLNVNSANNSYLLAGGQNAINQGIGTATGAQQSNVGQVSNMAQGETNQALGLQNQNIGGEAALASGILGGEQSYLPNVAQSEYAGENALLQPTFSQEQMDLQSQLARQGISAGSAAYNNAETQLGTQQNQALTSAAGSAMGNATTAANNMYNTALSGAQGLYGTGANAAQGALNTGANTASNIYGTGTTGAATTLGAGNTTGSNMYNLALQGQNQNIAQQQAVQQNPLTLLSMLYGGGAGPGGMGIGSSSAVTG